MRVLLAALLVSTAAPALAQSVHQYGALAISPAGDRIATLEAGAGQEGHARVTVRAVQGGAVLRTIDPCATCTYSAPTFGRGGVLAFLARDRTAGTVQLMVDDGRRARAVATVSGIAQTPRFSPDGKRIALLVTIGARKEAGAVQAGVRQVGEIGEQNDEQRLAVFDLSAGPVAAAAVKPVSPAGRYIYEYDWTPDGRGFVVTSALGNGDANWWVATLDAVDAQTGAVRQIARPKTQANHPRVSPDGRTVAYVGGLMSDFGSIGGDVFTVPFAGGTPRNMTEGRPLTTTGLQWKAGGIVGTTLKGDRAGLFSLASNQPEGVTWSAPMSFAAGDGKAVYSDDGRTVAFVAQDWEHAPAIYAGPASGPQKITRDNDAVPSVVKAQSITWRSDGYDVQGWLLGPRAPTAGKHPMIVNVHGGPASATTPQFASGALKPMIDGGYYIFLPNPRGSYGQGEAFTAANKRDFGGGDLRDILAGVDAAEKAAPIDDARLGLTGGSYGGFMAMWANTRTNRFKAIVAGAGLSNWVSYYGTNGINQWMLPFFGKSVYDDYKAYEDVSAVYHARTAKTPTLIYVGERDIEVPPTQSVEWWNALKANGVETSLVIYPDEGHGIRDPEHAADLQRRVMAWWAKYLR
ncbi:S9 family peptidase [Sphingomonas aracearum]|uniref:S9 family peptidase n=1 Tax=Sphingomonas aracearum TaxID=2283317 RepID=A0A369VVR5_9SPHN|nr:S9 family peptidase [Sphingomonas aracearum]RDE06183.1 S9 family peptidase [Sphingomonas aracearum]